MAWPGVWAATAAGDRASNEMQGTAVFMTKLPEESPQVFGPGYTSFLLSIFCHLFVVSALGAEFSSESCRELGFSSNLLCSSCDLLGQFNLLQLDPDCRGCCQEEAQFETKKLYAGAILEVCG
uniref:Selenoprotein F n=1 Tax=Bos indicus x Bos taurus TaxID=30522 RepID=A0A4W2CXN1_BOBOX